MRFTLLGLALAGNLAMLFAWPAPERASIHLVAPPLTHIPANAEPTLGPTTGPPSRGHGLRRALETTLRTVGSAGQRAALDELNRNAGAVGPLAEKARALRVQVEEDVSRLGAAIGPDRVGAILAERDRLSTDIGEGRVWADAARALSAPPPGP